VLTPGTLLKVDWVVPGFSTAWALSLLALTPGTRSD
jgi:hypothetical protein